LVVKPSWLGVALVMAACSGRYTVDRAEPPAAGDQTSVVVDSGAGMPSDASSDAPVETPDAPPDSDAQLGLSVCPVPSDIAPLDAGIAPGCKQEPVPENCPRKSCRSLCPPNNYAIGCYSAPAPRASLGCAHLAYDETTDRDDYCCPCR
jgi:hypothetical protein